MSHPDSHLPDPSAKPDAVDSPPQGAGTPSGRPAFVNPETALGGADAVQKTSYGVGRGTDPSASAGDAPTAHPSTGHGPNFLAWGIGAVAVLVAIIYLISVLA